MIELYPNDLKILVSEEDMIENGHIYAVDVFIMIEAVDQEDGSRQTLFTLEMFQEMIELDDFILNLTSSELNE